MQDHAGLLEKTAAGRALLGQRTGALDRRSRALLIMVDGRTSIADMVSRAGQLGLDAGAVAQLIEGGFVQVAARAAAAAPARPREDLAAPAAVPVPVPVEATTKRSLAAARMYLMDVMARTFGTPDHPLRGQLVEATDRAAVELVFDAFQVLLNDTASPSLVAHIEASFRDLLPLG
ncbi:MULTISPECIES: hypothetical protein [Cupriavidus]